MCSVFNSNLFCALTSESADIFHHSCYHFLQMVKISSLEHEVSSDVMFHTPTYRKKKKNFEKVEVEPEWKFARCIVGETSWENSAANFLSNTKSIQCFSPSVLDSAEQNHECLLVPSLIFADFNVIFIRAGAAPCRPRRAASPVGGWNLIFYSVCCSIQSGNVFSLGRLSKEHQIITYQLDYVIVRIGFLFGESPEAKRVRVWTAWGSASGRNQMGSQFLFGPNDWWLLLITLSLSGSFVSSLTVDFWRSVFALHSVWLDENNRRKTAKMKLR